MVHNGDNVLRMPATELSICCCAVVNKNAGIKTPSKPEKNNFPSCSDFTSRNFTIAIGNRSKPATVTRRAATSPGDKTTRPFFIKMKDVPQIKESVRIRKTGSVLFLFSKVVEG